MTPNFRAAHAADCGKIHEALYLLAASIGHPERLTSSPETLARDGFGPRPKFNVTLADIGGEIAGVCLHFPMYSTWLAAEGLYVQDLFIYPDFRSARLGEALLRHVACTAQAQGMAYMRLSVDHGNEGAARFYARNGFEPATDETCYKLVGPAFAAFCGAA